MSVRHYLRLGIEVAVVVAIGALVVGSLLGQPVLLGYVETGSMEPTLSAGDGFVAIPAAVAGPVQTGDVVVFEAQHIRGGGLTTHRVVGKTDRGFRTRGDANPVTDQQGDEPPVRREQIVAVAWQPHGHVATVPQLGTAVHGVQTAIQAVQTRLANLLGMRSLLGIEGIAALLFGLTAVLLLVDVAVGGGRDRTRDPTRDAGTSTMVLVGLMALAVVVAATAAMMLPAGSDEFTIVSAEFDSDRPLVVQRGEQVSVTHPVGNSGLVPVVSMFEPGSDAVEVDPRERQLGGRSVENVTLTLSAPEEIGVYRRYVTEHRYLELLPPPIIRRLYTVHPWVPVVAIDTLLTLPFVLFGLAVLGRGRVRSRVRDGPSTLARLRNRL